MRKISPEELKLILRDHELWLQLNGVTGVEACLRNTDLRDVDLVEANLWGVNLKGADLRGANLRGAYLRTASFMEADLRGADLQDADLRSANLRGAKLDRGIVGPWSIQGARFNTDALPWLMLRHNWSNECHGVHICEM